MAAPRRHFTQEEKLGIVQRAGELGIMAVLRENKLSYSVFSRWKKQFMHKGLVHEAAASNKAKNELKQLLEENSRLKKIIADQALELERREEELRKYVQGKR